MNPESYESAEVNIMKNLMENKISLIKSDGGVLNGVINPDVSFDVLLTNPPVYPSYDTQ